MSKDDILRVRVAKESLSNWQGAAKECGMKFSDWVEMKLNDRLAVPVAKSCLVAAGEFGVGMRSLQQGMEQIKNDLSRDLLESVAPMQSSQLVPIFPEKKSRLASPKSKSAAAVALEVNAILGEDAVVVGSAPAGTVVTEEVINDLLAANLHLAADPARVTLGLPAKKYTGACELFNGRDAWEYELPDGTKRWTGTPP